MPSSRGWSVTIAPIDADRDIALSAGAARVQELLGLTEEELCTVLDVDPLTLLSGQLDHRPEIPILLALLDEAQAHTQAGPAMLRRWVRAGGPDGVPLEALLRRDFVAFEDALQRLAGRGFVLRKRTGDG